MTVSILLCVFFSSVCFVEHALRVLVYIYKVYTVVLGAVCSFLFLLSSLDWCTGDFLQER